ncbi:MAG TPA: cysteine desulfurase [Chitinophagaceae bacterium]|nr:cysteine desulfurase [Chitinophagaceae bacterium]
MLQNDTDIITGIDVEKVRNDFPLLARKVFGKPLVYFDNAATSQKPTFVLDALEDYYRRYNANVHRGVHTLSQEATDGYEAARKKIADFINARHTHEIIYTRGTTESINLVAAVFAKQHIKEGDKVLISAMEHHSNIVPWQLVCEEKKATLEVIAVNEQGELLMEDFEQKLDSSVKIVAVTYVSNSLGTINPVQEIIRQAHAKNIPVLIDAAQAVVHLPIDVQKLDADFLAFSGHKIYGPTGLGILYGKQEWLNKLPPYQGGGEMIKNVTFNKTTYNDLPYKFEAGTPDVAGAIGLGAAIDYINNLGRDNVFKAEEELLEYAMQQLTGVKGLRIIGPLQNRVGSISFLLESFHPFDVGEILDKQGIAVRTGHHCTQPIMDFFCIPGTVRASLSFYNTKDEINALVKGLERARAVLG